MAKVDSSMFRRLKIRSMVFVANSALLLVCSLLMAVSSPAAAASVTLDVGYDDLSAAEKSALGKGETVYKTKELGDDAYRSYTFKRIRITPEEAAAIFLAVDQTAKLYADPEVFLGAKKTVDKSDPSLGSRAYFVEYRTRLKWMGETQSKFKVLFALDEHAKSYAFSFTGIKVPLVEKMFTETRFIPLKGETLFLEMNHVELGGVLSLLPSSVFLSEAKSSNLASIARMAAYFESCAAKERVKLDGYVANLRKID